MKKTFFLLLLVLLVFGCVGNGDSAGAGLKTIQPQSTKEMPLAVETKTSLETTQEPFFSSKGPNPNQRTLEYMTGINQGVESEFDGYIVKLKNLSVGEEKVRIEKTGGIASQTRLVEHRTKVKNEQASFESKFKEISAKGKVTGKVKNVLNAVFISNDVTEEELKQLINLEEVEKISPNYPVYTTLNESVPLIDADDVWQLDRNENNCLETGEECLTGKGITIGIIDTGIDYSHPDFGSCTSEEFLSGNCEKVIGGFDFFNSVDGDGDGDYDDPVDIKDLDPMDDQGHGTHVAATAAGNGTLKGVAPDAKLVAYKVLNEFGGGYASDVILAINRSFDVDGDNFIYGIDPEEDNPGDILDVISLSLGFICNVYTSDCGPDDSLSEAIDNAVDMGVIAVVAAGNEGPALQTIRTPGTARKAITVGAADKQLSMAGFSSKGPIIWSDSFLRNTYSIIKPDIVAPGVAICAAQFDSWVDSAHCLDDEHIAISGTSMAAPHVAGLAALVKQRNPNYNPEEIKTILKNTAQLLPTNQDKITTQGVGIVNALDSVFFNDPIVVSLFGIRRANPLNQQLETFLSLVFDIEGEVLVNNFDRYELAYAPNVPLSSLTENDWNIITISSEEPQNVLFEDFDITLIPDGEYLIRLKVVDSENRSFFDYAYFVNNKFDFTTPLNNDIVNPKHGLPIKIDNNYDLEFEDFFVEYSFEGGPWISEGIEVNVSELEAEIMPNTITDTGVLDIKTIITHDNFSDEFILSLNLDNTLKQGWPQRINFFEERPGTEAYRNVGKVEPTVGNVTGDDTQEIIIYTGGDPPKVSVYDIAGNLINEIDVGEKKSSGILLPYPLLADLDHDGFDEIIIFQPSETFRQDVSLPKIHAFNFDGSEVEGWPIEFELLNNESAEEFDVPREFVLSAHDIDLDNEIEIIAKDGRYGPNIGEQILIINENGTIQNEINLPEAGLVYTLGRPDAPSIGNFDDDPEFEIVLFDYSINAAEQINGVSIIVYNPDGSILEGFPVNLPGVPSDGWAETFAVGDVDNDGKMEIVVGLGYFSMTVPDYEFGGIYIIDGSGNILNGWPRFMGEFPVSINLADLDNDNDLEIIAIVQFVDLGSGESDSRLYILDHAGNILDEWFNDEIYAYYLSVVGSIDNGENGIVISADTSISNMLYGKIIAKDLEGNHLLDFPKLIEARKVTYENFMIGFSHHLMADVDEDGFIEVIASSNWDWDPIKDESKNRASIYVWETTAPAISSNQDWPKFRHDKQLTGCYNCLCGNNSIDEGEECDDGNLDNGDACNSSCELSFCPSNHIDNLNGTCTATLSDPFEDGSVYFNNGGVKNKERERLFMGKSAGTDWLVNRSYVEWNTSEIPDTAIIEDVDFLYEGGFQISSEIWDIYSKPSTSSAEEIFFDSGEGTVYIPFGSFPDHGTSEISLPRSAKEHLQNQLTQNWFAIGMKSTDEEAGSGSWIESEESTDANPKPTLKVTYKLPVCGNGIIEGTEQCDDGDTENCDGCNSDCSREDDVCGDGIIECGEACERGNSKACRIGSIVGTKKCNSTCTNWGSCQTKPTCFLENTEILTLNSNKKIQDLKIGDIVMSFNEQTGELEPTKVTKTFTHKTDSYLIINGKLEVTPNHSMQVNGKWVEIGNAKIGDKLQTINGEETINSIEVVNEIKKVFNIEVEKNHNYYADNYLAHNKIGGREI